MKTLRLLVLFGLVSLLANSQAKAGPTDLPALNNEGLPDLTGSYMDVTYNATTHAFVASGWTTDYNIPPAPGTDISVTPDSYTLSATISNGGVLASGGTLDIYGDVGSGDTLLLSGSLTPGAAGAAFGYGDVGNEVFQFLFTASGGSLESAFGGPSAQGGIVVDAAFDLTPGDSPFTGSWASSFNNNGGTPGYGGGDINSFMMVPEPSSILLVSAGILCMVARRRLNAPRA